MSTGDQERRDRDCSLFLSMQEMKLAGSAKQEEGHCLLHMCYKTTEVLRTRSHEQHNLTFVQEKWDEFEKDLAVLLPLVPWAQGTCPACWQQS